MLGLERYFFEVPIYRLSPEAHVAETDHVKALSLSHVEYRAEDPENYEFFSKLFDTNSRYCWDFNEIVAYVRLYALGDQIRGELWLMKAKRFRRGTKKKLRWLGKAFELSFSSVDSNDHIAGCVLERVIAVGREPPCQGRYIDVQCLKNAAPALDWRALLGLSAQVISGFTARSAHPRPRELCK